MKIAIVDDEARVVSQVETYIDTYYGHQQDQYQISRFHNGRDLLSGYHSVYDIIFLDIQMEPLDGLRTAQLIREQDAHVIIIFMTSLAKYAIRGYEVDALSFMVKPFGYGQFAINMKKAETALKRYSRANLLLNMDGNVKAVHVHDIYYVEVYDHWLIYYLESESYKVRGSIKGLMEQLGEESFVLCNRCYLVNLRYVQELKGEELKLGRYTLKVSRSRKKDLIAALTDYIGGSY